MEIQGKVVKVLDGIEYTSKRSGEKDYKYGFVIETQGQYPQKVAFSVFGKDRFQQMAIAVDGTYTVSFDISSREWKERWFTEATAFRATRLDIQTQQAQKAPQENASPITPFGTQGAQGDEHEDVPF